MPDFQEIVTATIDQLRIEGYRKTWPQVALMVYCWNLQRQQCGLPVWKY